MGEIKTVIDEAETQNVAMNIIFTMRVQEVIYKLANLYDYICCCCCRRMRKRNGDDDNARMGALMIEHQSLHMACNRKIQTFMNFKIYEIPRADSVHGGEKRPDLLNRVENYLVLISQAFDQQLLEQSKLLRDLKDQLYTVTYQIDNLRARLHHVESLDEYNRKNLKKMQKSKSSMSGREFGKSRSKRRRSSKRSCIEYDVKHFLDKHYKPAQAKNEDENEEKANEIGSDPLLHANESQNEIESLIYL